MPPPTTTSHDAQDTLTVLSGLPLFYGLESDALARIAGSAQLVTLTKGERVFAQGDPCVGFHVVLGGQIKLAMTSERGIEKVIEIVGTGHGFGEAVMFLDMDYIVSAEALLDSRLLWVAKDAVLAELERDPQMIKRFLGSLSLRLHHLLADIENYSLQTGRERVIGYLLNQLGSDDATEVHLPFKKSLLASRLNVTQEHFSRILHELSSEGLIEVAGRTIRLVDRDRLRRG
jgi:CRP/FNR family transcriptional regulator, dissimilatory nitrate respiration regulator